MSDTLLVDLVSTYSPSRREASAVRLLVDWMNANGFEASVDAAGSAVGVRGDANADRTLMLLGHIDTFPGELPVRIDGDILYGRGSVDAKGSLAAFAAATAAAAVPAGWRVVVVGAVEEEARTSKGARAIREAFTPDLCIIGEPSGAERITLGYKGRLLVDMRCLRPVSHTARPEASVGMIAVQFWNAVEAWVNSVNYGVERYFDQLMLTLNAINTTSDHIHNVVKMTMGFRLPPRMTPGEVFAAVYRVAPSGADVRAYSAERAYQGEKNTPLVRGLLAAIRAHGGSPGFVLKTGTSDMNVVAERWTCPIVAYGPGDSNYDHTPQEQLSLAEYHRAVATLRTFIEQLDTV